jgi:hypothetical protein
VLKNEWISVGEGVLLCLIDGLSHPRLIQVNWISMGLVICWLDKGRDLRRIGAGLSVDGVVLRLHDDFCAGLRFVGVLPHGVLLDAILLPLAVAGTGDDHDDDGTDGTPDYCSRDDPC